MRTINNEHYCINSCQYATICTCSYGSISMYTDSHRSIPVHSGPVRSTPVRSTKTPVRSTPVRSIKLRSGPSNLDGPDRLYSKNVWTGPDRTDIFSKGMDRTGPDRGP